MKRPWRDATHPLRNGMACWPGDPVFEHRLAASMGVIEFDSGRGLDAQLGEADAVMYVQKRLRKGLEAAR